MGNIYGSHIWLISSRSLARPQSLTNRCETQYFDGKKENVIPQRLTEFMMHQHICSTKMTGKLQFFSLPWTHCLLSLLGQTSEWQIVISWQFAALWDNSTNLCKFHACISFLYQSYFFSSLAALISICGLSDPVKTLIESFVGGPRLSFCSFSDYWEEWNCESGGNKNLNNKGKKSLSSSSSPTDIDATMIIFLLLNHLNSKFDKINEHAIWPKFWDIKTLALMQWSFFIAKLM